MNNLRTQDPGKPRRSINEPLSLNQSLPVKEDKEMHRQTLRMSLALARNGAVFRRSTRPGRRTKVRSSAPPSGSAHDGLPMVAPLTGKPGGLSRPDVRAPSNRMPASPAAHPQRYAPPFGP